MSEILLPVATLASLGALFFILYTLFSGKEESEIKEKLGLRRLSAKTPSPFLKLLRPLFPIFQPINRVVRVKGYRERIRRKFITAGMTEEMTPDEFMAYKLLMTILIPAFFFGFIRLFFNYSLPVFIVLPLTIYGFFFPDLWLSGRVAARQKEITLAMPYVLDLLTLSVEAGLDFISGIKKVVEKARPSALIEELNFFLNELRIGITRQQGLRNMAYRINLPEFYSFTAVLIQAERLGTSIGPVLRAQSDLLRAKRFQRAERAGAAASQKILFPLIFFILPAVFIVIFGPILLNFLYGGGPIGG